eukprot:1796491-Prymnesium_polylepis.1
MPSPSTPGLSSEPSKSVCRPRQMPRNGRSACTYAFSAAVKPRASSTSMHRPNAPTPGKISAVASAICSAVET